MKRTIFAMAVILAGAACLASAAGAALPGANTDIKLAGQSGIYYYGVSDRTAHPYPDMATFLSWHQESEYRITTVSQADFNSLTLSAPSLVKPGTLVKFGINPGVYRSESYGNLCYVNSTEAADRIYGTGWRDRIANTVVSMENYRIAGLCESEGQVENPYIKINGVKIPVSVTFLATSTVREDGYFFTLENIRADKSLDLSYRKEFLGQPCSRPSYDNETINVPLGTTTCVSSNTCNSGDSVCFTPVLSDGVVSLGWQVELWLKAVGNSFINVNGAKYYEKQTFYAYSLTRSENYYFTIDRIKADNSLDLSYQNEQLGNPCSAAAEGSSIFNIPLGTSTCISSNSCDGGDMVCFVSDLENGAIDLQWQVSGWTSEPF